ncbi:MAG TPA: hypothetical protein VHC49_24095 [Mycobacteriales bacterium]|nr:hypothetical protein [Mycobacteriales bacterium]
MPVTLKNMPTLDLTHMGPDDLSEVEEIKNIAMVLATKSQAAALARIPTKNVAKIVHIPDDTEANITTGMLEVGGDSFDKPQNQNKVLIITGALVVTSPVSQSKYREIHVTGGILAPYGSENALGAAITSMSGAILYYRYVEGQQIKSLSGQSRISGETLANGTGTADDILVAAGQLIVTGPVTTLGFAQLIVSGQCIAPRDSEPVLGPALTVAGQTLWYAGTAPRMFTGDESFGSDFFEYIEEPMSMVLLGEHTIEAGVDAALLKEKVSVISLFGTLHAPRELHGLLQFLAVENQGRIVDDTDFD